MKKKACFKLYKIVWLTIVFNALSGVIGDADTLSVCFLRIDPDPATELLSPLSQHIV